MVWKRGVRGGLIPLALSARSRRATPSFLTPGPPSPRLSPAQSRLVEDSIRLATRLARQWAARWPRWAEEFESEALFALVEACRRVNSSATQDRSEALRVLSYLKRRIRWALCDLARERTGRRRKTRVLSSSEVDLRLVESQGRTSSLSAARGVDPSDIAIQNERLALALSRLPARQAEVIRRTQLGGESPGRVAERLGISVKAVIRLRDRGLQGLDRQLDGSPRPRRKRRHRDAGVAPFDAVAVAQPPGLRPADLGLIPGNRDPTEAA